MTTNSTTTELERRVARALHDQFGMVPWASGTASTRAYHLEKAQAAIKAHAEWLESNELEIRAKPPFNFTVNLLEEIKPAARQEDRHHAESETTGD